MTKARLSIGAVASAHGVKGQFKVKPFTANPRDIISYGPVTAGEQVLTLAIRGMTSSGLVIVSAEEVTSREAASLLRGCELTVNRSALPAVAEDEIYHADLVGLMVETPDGSSLGSVVAMHDFGGGDIVEVKPGKGPSVMLPFGNDYVVDIDLTVGRMVLQPPEGLLEAEDQARD